MNDSNVYLSLDKEKFDKQKAKALRISEGAANDADTIPEYVFEDLTLKSTEFDFNGNELYISGDLEGLGYLSLTIPIDTDDAITFIEEYVKKMNKIKTILEAAK